MSVMIRKSVVCYKISEAFPNFVMLKDGSREIRVLTMPELTYEALSTQHHIVTIKVVRKRIIGTYSNNTKSYDTSL